MYTVDNKKNIINVLSAELAQRVKVKAQCKILADDSLNFLLFFYYSAVSDQFDCVGV